MNKKLKIILFSLLCISLISISAISAQDINDDIAISENNDYNNLEITSTATNFTTLQKEINENNEITLSNNITMSDDEKDKFTTGILINKTVAIDGNGYTIDANNTGRVFNVNGGSLTLKNITLTNGNTSGNGGAISATSSSNLTIMDSVFTGNNAKFYSGAIFAELCSNLTISDSVFTGNTASIGGAIIAKGYFTLTITNSNFTRNNASEGGAIYTYRSNLNITDSNFTSNTATNTGGAIDLTMSSNLTITDSTFTSNNASNGGGAIYAYISNLNITDSSFTSNNATNGGAISASSSNLTITDSKFTSNTATNEGGAINAIKDSNLNITNSRFINNNITGVDSVYQNAVLTVYVNNQTNATVKSNENFNLTATLTDEQNNTYYSAGLTYTIGNVNVTGDELFNAIANLTNTGSYNITATYAGIYNITNPSVNKANVTVPREDSFTALNQLIQENTNGTLTLEHNYTLYTDELNPFAYGIPINKTIAIDGNGYTIDANNTGRIFEVSSGNLTLKNITLTNGNMSGNGGAIYAVSSNLTITDSVFTSNNAQYGGAIYLVSQSNLNITDSIFTSNDASYTGGAIYIVSYSNCTITNSNFTSNNATNNGGTLYIASYSNLNIINSNFISDNATYGGAIYTKSSNLNITNSSFQSDNATYGGAIYATSYTNLTITTSDFTSNNASEGGAINTDISTLTITDSNFTSNNAIEYSGGAIYTTDSTLTITNSDFTSNNASEGGAIYATGSNLNITNSNFTSNTATNQGGAIYADSSSLNITGSNFTSNTATMFGGAISATSSSNLNITNSNFTSNNAKYGGAIYAYESSFNITNSNFTSNNATKNGGAISADVSSLNITNSRFINNNITGVDSVYQNSILSVFVNNQTNATVSPNENFNLTATLTDDQNNTYYSTGLTYTISYWFNVTGDELFNAVANSTTIGSYDITATYAGIYNITNPSVNNATLNVEDVSIVLTLDNLTKYYNDTSKPLIATLKKGSKGLANQTITFIVNGNEYNRTTDENGTASMNINLVPGVYAVNASYTNSEVYTSNATVTILTTINGTDLVKDYHNASDFYATFLNINGSALADTNVTFNINGVLYNEITDENGTAKLNIDLDAGNYTVTCINPVNNEMKGFNITVLSIAPSVNVTGGLAYNLGYDSVTVTLPSDATGNVTILINNVTQEGVLDNGTFIFYFWGVNPGMNNLTLNYTGDNNYLAINNGNYTFIAEKNTQFYIVTGNLNNDSAGGQIIVSGPADYGENITVIVNDTNYTQALVNGSLIIKIANLTVGTYNVTIIAENNTKYKAYNESTNLTFDKLNDYYHEITGTSNSTVIVKLPSDASGNITIVIGNNTFNATVNGTVIIPTGLATGDYNITVNYTGDNKYNALVWNQTIILPEDIELTLENLTKYYNDTSKQLIAVLTLNGKGLANETITFNVNGREYNRTTDENGTARMNINLVPGVYMVNASYIDGYDVYTVNATVTILSTINATDLVKVYKNASSFYATFYSTNGSALANTNITFNINGVLYNKVTDENGTAKLNINLDAGKYILTAINLANNENKGFNVTVLSTINSTDIVKYFRNGTQYSATFTSINGSILANTSVKFNINGVFYTRTTDNNGTATLNINLQPGNYTLTAINPITNETIGSNVLVKSVLVGEDLVKTKAEDKSYELTVLDGQGNPLANQTVKMNIHGVIYTKTTDSNGIARLAIRLDAGDYIITTVWNDTYTSNNIKVNP